MNREDIIISNFLTDENAYAKSVMRWANKIRSLNIEIGEKNKYISNIDGEGLFYNDGNPIFNNVNFELKKAFRIIQEDPNELVKCSKTEIKEVKQIEGWISKRTIVQYGVNLEIHELVISLFLTKDSIDAVTHLIGKWYSDIRPNDFVIEEYI